MCYSVYLSTDSEEDLSREDSESVHFEKTSSDDPGISLLKHEHKWYVGSKSGCSCTFRHLFSVELGFGGPVDWYEEEDDEINATLSFVAIVRRMIREGNQLDCIDVWYNAELKDVVEKEVNLGNMADEEFRFFESHLFRFF